MWKACHSFNRMPTELALNGFELERLRKFDSAVTENMCSGSTARSLDKPQLFHLKKKTRQDQNYNAIAEIGRSTLLPTGLRCTFLLETGSGRLKINSKTKKT